MMVSMPGTFASPASGGGIPWTHVHGQGPLTKDEAPHGPNNRAAAASSLSLHTEQSGPHSGKRWNHKAVSSSAITDHDRFPNRARPSDSDPAIKDASRHLLLNSSHSEPVALPSEAATQGGLKHALQLSADASRGSGTLFRGVAEDLFLALAGFGADLAAAQKAGTAISAEFHFEMTHVMETSSHAMTAHKGFAGEDITVSAKAESYMRMESVSLSINLESGEMDFSFERMVHVERQASQFAHQAEAPSPTPAPPARPVESDRPQTIAIPGGNPGVIGGGGSAGAQIALAHSEGHWVRLSEDGIDDGSNLHEGFGLYFARMQDQTDSIINALEEMFDQWEARIDNLLSQLEHGQAPWTLTPGKASLDHSRLFINSFERTANNAGQTILSFNMDIEVDITYASQQEGNRSLPRTDQALAVAASSEPSPAAHPMGRGWHRESSVTLTQEQASLGIPNLAQTGTVQAHHTTHHAATSVSASWEIAYQP